ncbi:MAG: hypothetical protein ACLP1X_24835, partial [Polyangiaceae bacterium]
TVAGHTSPSVVAYIEASPPSVQKKPNMSCWGAGPVRSQFGSIGGVVGFFCTEGGLASLYATTLGLVWPATVTGPVTNSIPPFRNIQPYFYWTGTNIGQAGNTTFSFNSGFQGANTLHNFLYIWPMISGRIAGMAVGTGSSLEPSPDGMTVYDPMSNVTWLADANIGARNTFGLARCTDATDTTACVALDGSMSWMSAMQFISGMNTAAHAGQSTWTIAAADTTCAAGYTCNSPANPMGAVPFLTRDSSGLCGVRRVLRGDGKHGKGSGIGLGYDAWDEGGGRAGSPRRQAAGVPTV